MRRREAPSPKAAEVLAEIQRQLAASEKPTIGSVAKALKKTRSPVAESIVRLERLRWIKRGRYKPGCPRRITLCASMPGLR
jgi:Mn-dependent DtxR family transcriptional regulator